MLIEIVHPLSHGRSPTSVPLSPDLDVVMHLYISGEYAKSGAFLRHKIRERIKAILARENKLIEL